MSIRKRRCLMLIWTGLRNSTTHGRARDRHNKCYPGVANLWRIGWFEVAYCISMILLSKIVTSPIFFRYFVSYKSLLTSYQLSSWNNLLMIFWKSYLRKDPFHVNNNRLFDMAFLEDVTKHLDHLNMKMQNMNKLFPNFSKLHHCIQDQVTTVHFAVKKCG